MLQPWWRLLAALAVCAGGVARADGSLRCGSRLVSIGDARIDLLGRCGEPALRDRRVDERFEGVRDGEVAQSRRVTTVVEDWTYDFGPQSFVHVVTLVNGKITAIERQSYGYASAVPAPASIPRARCDPGMVHEGDAKLDVLARCGEPALVDSWDEIHSVLVRAGHQHDHGQAVAESASVHVEVWTYDMGPNQFVRFIRLENGRVTAVSTGTYGYAH
jgi:hypothetical protein